MNNLTRAGSQSGQRKNKQFVECTKAVPPVVSNTPSFTEDNIIVQRCCYMQMMEIWILDSPFAKPA